MEKRIMNKDEIWEFNTQKEVQEYSDQLVDEFDKYRIFGDNSDFTEFNK